MWKASHSQGSVLFLPVGPHRGRYLVMVRLLLSRTVLPCTASGPSSRYILRRGISGAEGNADAFLLATVNQSVSTILHPHWPRGPAHKTTETLTGQTRLFSGTATFSRYLT